MDRRQQGSWQGTWQSGGPDRCLQDRQWQGTWQDWHQLDRLLVKLPRLQGQKPAADQTALIGLPA